MYLKGNWFVIPLIHRHFGDWVTKMSDFIPLKEKRTTQDTPPWQISLVTGELVQQKQSSELDVLQICLQRIKTDKHKWKND